SYGLGRAEVVAALGNAVLMLAIIVGIVVAAIDRLRAPRPVAGEAVALVALIGLAINIGVAWLLVRGERTMNIRGALLHVLGDLLGSVAALVSGIVIWYTDWYPIDPLLSLVIVALILAASVRLLRDAVHALMEGVPLHLSLSEIGTAIAAVEGVRSVHDLHVWTLSSNRTALSAHVLVDDLARWDAILRDVSAMLHERFGIEHVTLQPESIVQAVVPVPAPP